MGEMTTLEVCKSDLTHTRMTQHLIAALKEGEVLLRIDRYALTANNISYGAVGDTFGYWNFFPAGEGWGVIPVWGFAEVIESRQTK